MTTFSNTHAILFDVDGTLLDTAADFAYVINLMRQEKGLPDIKENDIKHYAGHGSTPMIKYAFGIDESDPVFATLRQQLLDLYKEHIARFSKPFDGIRDVLHILATKQMPWGIVTSRPGWSLEPLLTAMQLKPAPQFWVAGDTLPVSKPHPEPLLHACEILTLSPKQCLYIGDTEVDVQAARAAGMAVLIANYGYGAIGSNPNDWQADGYLDTPLALLDYL
ncbi:MAG: HAD family hydrolase [Gammaproteobacteria bacterium]